MGAIETSSENQYSDPFFALCGLTSFVANAEAALTIDRELTPSEVSVLASLLASGTELSHLTLTQELPPGAADQFGSALASSTIHTLHLESHHGSKATELFRTLAVLANPALQQLSILSYATDHDTRLNDSFGQLIALRSLTISASGPFTQCTPLLIAAIGKLHALESLTVSKIALSAWDAETLAEALRGLPQMTDLGISSSNIGTEAARAIGGAAGRGRIRKLRLDSCQIQDEGASAMVDAILDASRRSKCKFQELDLSCNCIGPTGGEKLVAELLARSPRLRSLNLSGNPIGDTAAFALGKALTRSLWELNVSECDMTPRGVEFILRVFLSLHPPAFSVLRIGLNNLRDFGAWAVANLLCSGGRRLTELDIKSSDITEEAALELPKSLAKVYTLNRIDMSENPIGPRGATAIIDALSTAASTMPMDTINLQSCKIEDDGASAVGRLIVRRGCKNVFLSNNGVRTMGMKAIADSVADSACMIETLDLSVNLGFSTSGISPTRARVNIPIQIRQTNEQSVRCPGMVYLLDKFTQQQSRPQKRLVRTLNIKETGMNVEVAMAVKRAMIANGAIYMLLVNMGDEKANEILKEAERDSKSSGHSMLILM